MILSQPAARHQTERQIYKQRNADMNTDLLQTKLKQEFYEKEFAKFENKGQVVAKNKYVAGRLSQMRAQAKMELNRRKGHLAQILNQEHQQFKQEICDLQETPEQVRQKMQERVAQLKSEKENERKQYVEAQLERRFHSNADELRKVDQEYNELKALQERNIQMMEKQKLLEDKYMEEVIYAELYKRDIKKKEREDQKKLMEAKAKNDERNIILGTQYEMNNQKREAAKDQKNEERAMLKNEWKAEDLRHEDQMKQQQEFLKNLNEDIRQTNSQQQSRKAVIKSEEKQEDKIMIEKHIQKEKMLEYLENQQKIKTQQETMQFMKHQAARNNDAEIFEKEAEKLIAIEAENIYQKQKAKWAKEEEARVKLMYQVYGDRENAVHQKQQVAEVVKADKEVEKDILNKAVKEYEEEIERKRIEEFQTNKRHQNGILSQAEEKEQKRQLAIEKKQAEEAAELQRQKEYQMRINAKKEQGRLMLDELRKQRPF